MTIRGTLLQRQLHLLLDVIRFVVFTVDITIVGGNEEETKDELMKVLP